MINYYLSVLKNYAVFEGRARRSEYWYFTLANIIVSVILTFVDSSMGLITFGVSTVYSLAVLLPSLAVAVRRMHDIGKSGWFILIPIYNIILAATEGDKGPNEYGVDPKDPNAQSENSENEIDSIGENLGQ